MKTRLRQRCFSMNYSKQFRRTFLKVTYVQLVFQKKQYIPQWKVPVSLYGKNTYLLERHIFLHSFSSLVKSNHDNATLFRTMSDKNMLFIAGTIISSSSYHGKFCTLWHKRYIMVRRQINISLTAVNNSASTK